MNKYFNFLCIFLIIHFGNTLRICSRMKTVSYMDPVLKRRFDPNRAGWTIHMSSEVRHKTMLDYHCCDGYEGELYDCQPKCPNACSGNGICESPYHCKCNPDYGGNDCQLPICGNCNNQENSFCSEPGKCLCKAGYASNDTSITSASCFPICEPKCKEHSQCVSPNKCQCLEGYSDKQNINNCQPVCQHECPEHAHCHEPDICNCNLGYIRNGEICEPVCRNNCSENSKCTAPDLCECIAGYEKFNGTENCKLINLITSTTESESEPETSPSVAYQPKSTSNQRRSITSTTTTKVPLIEIPLNNCTDNCECWSEHDDMGSILNTKCVQTCSKIVERNHCLNLTYCHCYQPNGPIICKEDDGDESFEELQYNCTIRTSVKQNTEKRSSTLNVNQSSKKSTWPIIVGTIISICAILSIGLALYYKKAICFQRRTHIEGIDEPLIDENL